MKTRDVPCKTQNSGVTLSATTDSFARARDQNLVDGMVIYYGIIQDIIEIDYWEEESCPNIEETFWKEPNDEIGSSERLLDIDVRWSREDLPVDIIDVPSIAQHSQDVAMETSKEEDDVDDTDWDWMEADD
ncbi:hypothetical protein KY290_001688 [Solanum tuberosum]|uniref:Uncharacterized protein n=1 Tax=Solanum tuberosum TaxID=4113 RepID=A0ABQ7WNG1_SOLTU|nr:hypothetical protein KY284_001724 [Solanum tuberosum]KAH0782090.1 hypothetical protein KY290_001688 [Solanum tuberosum]